MAQFCSPFGGRTRSVTTVTRSCLRRAFLFVVVFAIKTYNFSYSKFLLLPSYVLLPFLPHASLLDSSTAMSSPTLDGVVVGCWVRVGFRWWFDYTHHQVICPITSVHRCIITHPVLTFSPCHRKTAVCTQKLPLCNCSTSGAPPIVLSSHCPLNFLRASPSTGRLRCV